MATASSSHRELPVDLIVEEILIRLPIKQVLKCMYVSKAWCSIIRQPEFIQAYRSRNPFCMLLSIPHFLDGEYGEFPRLYCSNMASSGQQEFFNLLSVPLFDPKWESWLHGFYGVTQMINGLFCSYLGNCVYLVNMFSGQVTQLPRPDIPDAFTSYYFGFIHATGLYKLLCLYEISFASLDDPEATVFSEFYILNINGSDRESSWKLLQLPEENADLSNLYCKSISVNGTLYWIRKQNFQRDEYVISCFDLTTEKFTKFIVVLEDQPRKPRLVQFRGKLSIFYCKNGDMITVTLEMDGYWTVHLATLPDELQQGTAIPIGNLSTNQIVLTNCKTNGSNTPVYAYNYGSNKFERFVVGNFPPSLNLENRHDIGSVISCVEQNIEMVEALIHRFSPRY